MTDLATRPADQPRTDPADLDDDALAAALAELEGEFDRLHDDDCRDIPLMTGLADRVEALRTEQTGRTQRASLRDRVHPVADATTTASFTDQRRNGLSLAQVARRAPQAAPPARRSSSVTITAAASGQPIDLDGVARSMHETARMLSDHEARAIVASVELPYPALGADPTENLRVLLDVVGQPEAQALVASGGWCAPSTPIFDLFDLSPDASGLIDLPSVRARGGALVPDYLGFGDVGGALWTWDEATDLAAADNDGGPDDKVKPCLRVPCPEWVEYRLAAEGLCVTHGNLSDRAWPELSRQFVNLVMGAHLHRVSAAKIARIASGATAVAPDASMVNSDAAGDVLGVIGLAAADARSQYRLGRRRAVEVALPDWSIEALRANVAKRAGVDLLSVTDAEVVGWFTSRQIRPQFLSDYQPLSTGAPATRWPATIEFLVWISGAYIALDGGQIDLGVMRDSVMNSTNDFTLAWSEQFFAVAPVGPKARKYTVPLAVDGVTGCCPAAA